MAAVAERLRRAPGMVSFFGKSFDRPRLEDKMRIVGVPAPFDGLAHLGAHRGSGRVVEIDGGAHAAKGSRRGGDCRVQNFVQRSTCVTAVQRSTFGVQGGA